MARPSKYSDALAGEICSRIAQGTPLRTICADAGMPGLATVITWLGKYPEFQAQYARAREEQADALADDIVRIADEAPPPDSETGKIDSAWVAWQRNRIDARKWTAMKLKPKKYGYRVALTGAADGAPIQVESRHVFDTVLKNLEATRQIEVNDD